MDYREYTYSAGKIPGGFFKREGRPSEREILTSRLIDRPLRPLFPEGWSNETQIVAMVLSADSENDPDVIAVTAASAALYISKIPFTTPDRGGARRLARRQARGEPDRRRAEDQPAEPIVAGSEEAIVMVESGALEVSEERWPTRWSFGHAEIKKIIAAIKELQAKVKPKKVAVNAAGVR